MLLELGELSCEACILGMKVKVLIDTGASVSLKNSEVMNRLIVKQTLSEAELVINQEDGSQMKIEGKMSYKGRQCGSKSHPICGSRVVCGTNLKGRLIDGLEGSSVVQTNEADTG